MRLQVATETASVSGASHELLSLAASITRVNDPEG